MQEKIQFLEKMKKNIRCSKIKEKTEFCKQRWFSFFAGGFGRLKQSLLLELSSVTSF